MRLDSLLTSILPTPLTVSALLLCLASALEESCGHIDEDTARLTKLRDKLIAGLSKIPHSALNGDPVHRLPTNVNFCFEGIEGESLLLLLDAKGISASSGSACTSRSRCTWFATTYIRRTSSPRSTIRSNSTVSACRSSLEEAVGARSASDPCAAFGTRRP